MDEHPSHSATYWRRHSAALFRWLHIYLSMVSFAILFFFALTGITLNHAEWFGENASRTTTVHGHLEPRWVRTADQASVDRLPVVELLRSAHGIKGALAEFVVDDEQCRVSFRGPGYTGDATIERASGDYDLSETRMGLVTVLNDLHKGRDTGKVWSWVIDLSAGLMVAVSLTGLVLIFFLKRRRVTGLISAVVGALLSYLIYRLFVP